MLRKRTRQAVDSGEGALTALPTPKRPAITPMKLSSWDAFDEFHGAGGGVFSQGQEKEGGKEVVVDLEEKFPETGGVLYREVRLKERKLGRLWRKFAVRSGNVRNVHILETSEVSEFEEGYRSIVGELFGKRIDEFHVEFQGVRNLWVTRNFARLENSTISDWKLWHEQGLKFSNPLLGRVETEAEAEAEGELRATQLEIRQWNKENSGKTATSLVLEIEDLTHARSLTQQEAAPSTFSGQISVFTLLDLVRADCIRCGRLPRLVAFGPFDRAQRRPLRVSAVRTEFDSSSGCTVKVEGVMNAKIVQDLLNEAATEAGDGAGLEVEVVTAAGVETRLKLTNDREWTA